MKCFLVLCVLLFSYLHLKAQLLPGVIQDSIICLENPDQSYALYLPSYYDANKIWPVVFIFEPAARGSLPVKLMQEAAEKFGYLLLGSNNSRNGSWDLVFEAADAMLIDAQQRFNLDTDNFYTSGFSGGSRAAMAIAVLTGSIRGVIGCGAGLPSNQAYYPENGKPFNYVGIVGNRDMNYREHILLKQKLNDLAFNNQLLITDTGHQWPDKEVFLRAFSWLELMQIKQGIRPNTGFIKKYLDTEENLIRSLIDLQDFWCADFHLEQLRNDLHPIYDTSLLLSKYDNLKKEKRYKEQQKVVLKITGKEDELITRYLTAFSELYFTKLDTSAQKGYEWWNNEIRYLKRMTKNSQQEKSLMGFRMLNLISARSAESSFRFVNQMNYEIAQILNELWIKTEHNSVLAHWHMAKIYALQRDRDNTLKYLELAYNLGMKRPASIENEEAFNFVRYEDRYQRVLKQLKMN